jgi:hypothetical protein
MGRPKISVIKDQLQKEYEVVIMRGKDGSFYAYSHGGRVVAISKTIRGLESCLKKSN